MGDGGCPATMGMARENRGNHSIKKEEAKCNAGNSFFILIII